MSSSNHMRNAFPSFFASFLILFCLISLFLGSLGGLLLPKGATSQLTLSPTAPPIVIIDAGHGGEDGGAIGINGVYEKDINLSIAKKLDVLLRATGIQTVLTRSEDKLLYDRNTDYEGRKKALDMQARLDITRQYDSAIFISIHQNTFGKEQYSGLQVYHADQSDSSLQLAQTIQRLVSPLCPTNNRKVKNAGTDIFLLEHVPHPSVLVECGFLSNREECEKLSEDGYQKQVATLLCAAVCDFFEQNTSFTRTAP